MNQFGAVELGIETILVNVPKENAKREGLAGTPTRVAHMFDELLFGYNADIGAILRQFECESKDGGMVIVKAIPFYSLCEHHMMPFFGEAAIGYLPANGKVVGLSKFARLVDAFGRRLQVQERMTNQIVDALVDHVAPDCMCVIEARHLCMEIRGVEKPGTLTVTSAVRGKFKESFNVRQEFLALIGGR
jgi:GTP cyclohydrolase I